MSNPACPSVAARSNARRCRTSAIPASILFPSLFRPPPSTPELLNLTRFVLAVDTALRLLISFQPPYRIFEVCLTLVVLIKHNKLVVGRLSNFENHARVVPAGIVT